MDENLKRKYIALKPTGFGYFIWFDTHKVIIDAGFLVGQGGLGKGGVFTNIKCRVDEIDCFIYSDELQYT